MSTFMMKKNPMEFGDFRHSQGAFFLFVISLGLLLGLPHDSGGVLD